MPHGKNPVLRLTGACLILLAGAGLAYLLASAERRRVETAEAYLDFLRYIRAQIDCFCRPRGELFSAYENRVLERTGTLARLRESGSLSVTTEKERGLDGEVRAWLCAFDRELGRSYREEQLAACDYYISRLKAWSESARGALPARIRVRRTVAVTGALMLILLLL